MNFDSLKGFLDHLVGWRVPGNCVSVCLDGKEVFSYASGFADLEKQIPMTNDHYVNIYSSSKVATVVAALQLYEQGRFLLDDPLYAFIPEYRKMYVSSAGVIRKAERTITLRHLFTMTSGLTYAMDTEAFRRAKELTGGKMDTQAVVRCLAKDPLSFEPGSSWQYGLSHDVLAAVVEIVSGMRFQDYVHSHIFAPLGIEHATYHNESVRDRMACQYEFVNPASQDHVALQSGLIQQDKGSIRKVSPNVSFVFGENYDSGGAGITTTVSDYSKFCAALANGGVGTTGERILSPATIDLLRTNQLNPSQIKGFNWPQLRGYGYGLGVRTMMDIAAAGSNGNLGEFGWGGAAGATVLVDPSARLSVFYAQHMLNPNEAYYQPRLRNVVYGCL